MNVRQIAAVGAGPTVDSTPSIESSPSEDSYPTVDKGVGQNECVADSLLRKYSPDNWARQYGGPLYSRLSQSIAKAIRTGGLAVGEALPSERELAQISQLSRVTVRRAVQQLVRDGYVVKKGGSGSMVAPRSDRLQQSLSRLTSFSEDMQRRGWQARSSCLECGVFPPSPQEHMVLGLGASDNVARISRLRIANNRPLAIERAALDAAVLPEPQNIGSSLYAWLAAHSLRPARATQRISAHLLSAEDARLLEVDTVSAGLKIERVSYLESGRVIEFTRSVYRGDAYDFVAELRSADHQIVEQSMSVKPAPARQRQRTNRDC